MARTKRVWRVCGVPPKEAVLVGTVFRRDRGRSVPAFFGIAVYCPYCRRMHYHGWGNDANHQNHGYTEHRQAHCDHDKSPLEEYYIALDPAQKAINVAVFSGLIADPETDLAKVFKRAKAKSSV